MARDFDAILVGAFGDPRVPSNIHAKEILLGMRSKMDLYANVRPVRLMDAALCPLKGIEPKDLDFVVIRENTEGVYTDLGGIFKQGTPDEIAIQEDINTRKGVERIIRYAFEYCAQPQKTGRLAAPQGADVRQVQCHDPRRQPMATRLQGSSRRASQHRDATHVRGRALHADGARSAAFDVVVTNNMFGDIITDLAAGLQGGLGHGRQRQSRIPARRRCSNPCTVPRRR